MELRAAVNRPESGGDGMVVDHEGRPFITSHVGIQMFDPTGRLGGVIAKPSDKACVSVTFAGADRSWLYACQHLIPIPNPPPGMGFTHVSPESGHTWDTHVPKGKKE